MYVSFQKFPLKYRHFSLKFTINKESRGEREEKGIEERGRDEREVFYRRERKDIGNEEVKEE